jgi:putative transposase
LESETLSLSGLKKRLPTETRERLLLVDPAHPAISLVRQSELLHIARSSIYYQPLVNPLDKPHMDAIDEIFTDHPFYGSRRIQVDLRLDYGIDIGRQRVQHLMRSLGLVAIYPKPNLSKAAPMNEKYPYLLRGLPILRPNQVFGSDITYIRTAHGFVYLVAFIDWFSRYVVAWRLSDTMKLDFCLEALDEALAVAIPEISNTDQGSHFTAEAFTGRLLDMGVKISMDGRGRCMDNIFTERLWRTVKYENVFLKSYRDLDEARVGLTEYLKFYNQARRHQSLGYRTPASVYFGGSEAVMI